MDISPKRRVLLFVWCSILLQRAYLDMRWKINSRVQQLKPQDSSFELTVMEVIASAIVSVVGFLFLISIFFVRGNTNLKFDYKIERPPQSEPQSMILHLVAKALFGGVTMR